MISIIFSNINWSNAQHIDECQGLKVRVFLENQSHRKQLVITIDKMPIFNQNGAILILFHHQISVILPLLCCSLRGKCTIYLCIIVEYWIKQSTGYHLWSRLWFCRKSHSICPNSMALKKTSSHFIWNYFKFLCMLGNFSCFFGGLLTF